MRQKSPARKTVAFMAAIAGSVILLGAPVAYGQQNDASPKITKQQYADAEAELKKLVSEGKVTREQAERRLSRMKQMMVGQNKTEKIDWESINIEIEESVKNGEITREEARVKFEEVRRQRMAESAGDDMDRRLRRYEAAAEKMKQMVADGEITKEQMDQRLAEMKKRMSATKQSASREQMAKAIAEIRKAVETGKISQKDADARIAAMRKAMSRDSDKPQQSLDKRDYAQAEKKMKQMVADGEITQEQMDQRLGRMRLQMTNKNKMKDAWEAFNRRIESAVANGDMTPEEAREAQAEFRQRMAARDGGARSRSNDQEVSDECRALGLELRKAVREGTMTADEARAAYAEKCGG